MDHFYMNFFHAFLKLTISLLKNKSAQTFLFFIFEKEQKKSRKTLILRELLFPCGETGIRTPGTSRYNGFQDRRNRPLCHLSRTLRESCLVFQRRCKGTHYFEICKYLPPFLIIFFHCRTFAGRKNETNKP